MFGVFAPGEDVARMACFGLQALQHRGQESAGIAVGDGETVMAAKDLGLVTQVFDEATLAALEGFVAVGHARYSTSGGAASWEAAQPRPSGSSPMHSGRIPLGSRNAYSESGLASTMA